MATIDLSQRLAAVLRQWDGVEATPAHHGTITFRVQRREIGHVHASGVADLPFPLRTRRELVSAGRATAHRTEPHSGWVSFRLRNEHDVPAAVELFRLNYERVRGLSGRVGQVPLSGRATIVGGGTLPAPDES